MAGNLNQTQDQYVETNMTKYDKDAQYGDVLRDVRTATTDTSKSIKSSNPDAYKFLMLLYYLFLIFVIAAIVKLSGMHLVKVLFALILFLVIFLTSVNNRLLV